MKKIILILSCIFFINLTDCFTQSLKTNNKEFNSKTRYVYGHFNDFNDNLYLGITFGKVIYSTDTTYYIKFLLNAPTSEFRSDIYINKSSSITFLAKSRKIVNLKMSNIYSLIESDKQTEDLYETVKVYNNTTTLILNVTKEKLIEIGAEPFYKIILPYYNSSSKVNNEIVFIKPTIFIPRTFIQKNIKYILNI